MDDDAGEQTAAAIKDRDQQKTDRDRKNDLAQVFHQIPAAAVDQINDMPDAEGHAGDDGRRLDIILGDGREQQPAEDHLLQKADAEHTHDTADRPCRRVVDCDAVPQVPRRQNSERHIIEKPPGGYARPAKAVPLHQTVLTDKNEKNDRLQKAALAAYSVPIVLFSGSATDCRTQ